MEIRKDKGCEKPMKKAVLLLLTGVCIGLSSCGISQRGVHTEQGRIGDDLSVSREMAAKTISLSFYTEQELEELEQKIDFPDVSESDWAYPYINGAVTLGFLSGDEDGNFYPQKDLTLIQAQVLMDRLAPDFESRIALNDENQNMAVAYSLWVQLLEKALQERRGEQDLSSYGITKQSQVLFLAEENSGLFERGKYEADGLALEKYENTEITFLEKEGEILALLDVADVTPTIENVYCNTEGGDLCMETGQGNVCYAYKGESVSGICDVTLENGGVADVQQAADLGQCTVKRVNGQEIYLAEQGLLEWADDFRVYDATKESPQNAKVSHLICGMDNGRYYLKNGKIAGAVITKQTEAENIRVLVGGAGQQKVTLTAEKGFTLQNHETKKTFAAGEQAVLTPDLDWFSSGILEAIPMEQSNLYITFDDGTKRSYAGVLELENRQNGICVVNTLPLETYLQGVVPHEMPVDFGKTALQAQAITARSYAYNQIFANSYCGYGAHLTDDVASQVYLGADTDPLADEAVADTEGICLTNNGDVVTTYFYSTSCGYGSNAQDVWSEDGTFSKVQEDYLTGGVHGVTEPKPKTEQQWLAFWQNWDVKGYDQNSPWYRWKVYFGAGQLSQITAQTLQKEAKQNPNHVQVLQNDGSWQNAMPKDLGKLKGISVVDRAENGVIRVLQLDYENGSVQVKTEYSIRKVLSPNKGDTHDEIYLQRKDGKSLTGSQILPSAYFAVKEMKNEQGVLTGVAFYGGGNGHGVGMSQYGAKGMAEQDKTAIEILQHYFPNCSVERKINP